MTRDGDSANPVQAERVEQGQLPLLYKNPQPLTLQRHQRAGLREISSFAFARATNSVPLGADEMLVAQADFPIVFTETDPAVAVAVLGIGGDRNVFVTEDGKWRAGTYVPAYFRRYPFILVAAASPGDAILAIDEAAESFAMGEGRPLFDGEKPSRLTLEALEFCRAFQIQFNIACAFGEALRNAGLLVSKRVDIRQADGSFLSLENFRIMDEVNFEALANETFLLWRRNGWLSLAYAHLMSMRKWQGLAGVMFGA